ncbi:phosphotransferase family protein [Halorarius halobius]|uniref:phosphotransferase family protein n=1 Tax=Halorarius halobius TaxID=2962671 RepID=UPI0020CB7784|nr:phosphotransferase [Halorarius halobius]
MDDDERVSAALQAAFPDRTVDRVGAAGPSWNDANHTVGVEFADGDRCYLKIASDGDGIRIARERAVVERVDGVPVPDVLAADAGGDPPYLVTRPVDGDPLIRRWDDADADGRRGLARRVGRSLATVHDHRFDSHGHVVGGTGDGLDVDAAPWSEVLVDTVRNLQSRAPCDRRSEHFEAVVAAVRDAAPLLDDAPAALLHGDPAQPNCFVVDDEVGFLDWEIAHVGDPARDVVRARDQQFDPLRGEAPPAVVDAFHDGYRERAGGLPEGFERRQPLYEAVRLLGVSGYLDRTAEFVDEPVGELTAWLDVELNRRLDRIPV